MMNLKGKDIINMEKCGRLYELSNMVTTEKNKYFHIASATKEIIKKSLLMKGEEFSNFIKESSIREELDKLIPDNTFLPLAKGEFLKDKTQELIRYINFLKGNNYKLIASNPVQDIIVEGEIVTLTADFIFESNNGIEVVKIKRKEPELSYRARTFENKPENNLELFLLSLLGDWLYPDTKFTQSFHHMKAKGDKDLFRVKYDLKKGYNIISHEYNNEEIRNNMERIKELVREIKNKNSEKVYDEQSCRVCPYLNVCNYSGNKNIELEEIKEEIKAPKDFQLTNSQREAVIMTKGIARINAGAGSGKTTVVALRVVELILDGCEPEDIILITFTNKGAQEMRDKIAYWLEQEGIDISKDRFNITTFNAWGDKLIMENPEVFGFTQAPKLVDKVEKYDILFNILENGPKLPNFDYKNPVLNFRYAKGAVPKLESIFDFMKAYNALTKEAINEKAPGFEVQILDMYKQYNKILKERNLIEYQDQITLIAQIIEEENEILEKENYKHIIVDEYQDCATR